MNSLTKRTRDFRIFAIEYLREKGKDHSTQLHMVQQGNQIRSNMLLKYKQKNIYLVIEIYHYHDL